MPKLVIFTGGLNDSVLQGIVALIRGLDSPEILIAEQNRGRSLRRLWRNQVFHLKRSGWRWLVYQGADGWRRWRARHSRRQPPPARVPGSEFQRERVLNLPGVTHFRTPDLCAATVLERIRAFEPDLGISLAAPILKTQVFSIPHEGTINLHKGRLPDYRGMPPAFWELWNEADEVGCSVHRVEAGLDTGAILVADRVPCQPYSTTRGLQIALDELGVRLTVEAARGVLDGALTAQPQPPGGRTYQRPTVAQEWILARRLRVRQPTVSPLRRWAKDLAFGVYVGTWRPVPRYLQSRRGAQPVVVLLYHRVSDEFRDGVTVGVEQFERQMSLIKREYPLVTIEQVIADDLPRDASRPLVAVTFDDGYRDNHTNAMPILRRIGVPAAFFVSTGIVGTDRGFSHDERKLGRVVPAMSWDEIGELHANGFTIGSHTVNHANCAHIAAAELAEELAQSRDTLHAQLGLQEIPFAYPFGGRNDINPAALQAVRDAGYVACLSAYGGCNVGPIDRYNVLRTGINWAFTETAFRARLETLC